MSLSKRSDLNGKNRWNILGWLDHANERDWILVVICVVLAFHSTTGFSFVCCCSIIEKSQSILREILKISAIFQWNWRNSVNSHARDLLAEEHEASFDCAALRRHCCRWLYLHGVRISRHGLEEAARPQEILAHSEVGQKLLAPASWRHRLLPHTSHPAQRSQASKFTLRLHGTYQTCWLRPRSQLHNSPESLHTRR